MRHLARLAAAAAAARSSTRGPVYCSTDASLGLALRLRDFNIGPQGDQASTPLLRILPPIHRLQLRSCSGSQDGDESRVEALEKLRCLVDGWILEGDGEGEGEGEHYPRLASSSGLVDEWNLEEWRDTEAEPARDGARNLLQGHPEEEAQEIANRRGEAQTPSWMRGKKVFGMDKDLPPRVLVEFTEATSLANLTASDANKLFTLSTEDEARFFCEGLPSSFTKEFDISGTSALLIRNQFLKLVSHLRHMSKKKNRESTSSGRQESVDIESKKEVALIEPIAYMSLNQKKKLARERRLLDKADLGMKKQIVLDGLPGSGKSVLLAMLVQWARSEGWLVCYIPSGRKWTHNDLYYKNKSSGLWDTPVQAAAMLENFLKSHSDILEVIPCRIFDPITLGEGPGIGRISGSQETPIRDGFTLKDLVQLGIASPHAAVGVVVRLRKELSLVEEVPVLIAVDEFNSWFTFSGYHESYNEFGRRQIHAKELAMVHAFRDMTYGPFMVGAFSHSTNVGKLPKQLPGILPEAKVFLNRYDFFEASVMLKHYMRKWCPKAKFGKRARRALYMLTNGNATELRDTAFLSAAGARDVTLGEAVA